MASTVYIDKAASSFQVKKNLTLKGNTKAGFEEIRNDGRIIAKGNIIEGIEAKE